MTRRIGAPDTDTDIALRKRLEADGSRHFIMVAGAGSGKTTSLVKALAHIDSTQGETLRRMGQKIACITYTEIAVSEIRGDVGADKLYHISTIHSFLWRVIRPFQTSLKEWVSNRLRQKILENEARIQKTGTQQRTKRRLEIENERYLRETEEINQITNFRYGTGSDYGNGVLGHNDILRIGTDLIHNHTLMRRIVARRYPVIFVDESQDTDPHFVDALLVVANECQDNFCVGFFGDPVQKIFMQGKGLIPIEEGWQLLQKPENFRCSQSVLKVINRIREEDDGLIQIRGRHEYRGKKSVPIEGTARVLIIANDERRSKRVEEARQWLAKRDDDNNWLVDDDENALRMLVLVHRVAADRLGYLKLYSALNDKSTDELSLGFADGTTWVVEPLVHFLLPLLMARKEERSFNVMQLLRKFCPKIQEEELGESDIIQVLNTLKKEIAELDEMLRKGTENTIGDVITYLREHKFWNFEARYDSLIDTYLEADKVTEPSEENAELRFMQCNAFELWGYRRYIERLSPFATQHGIKGAEFEKVLVEVDGDESRLPGFSYGKYFGIIQPSKVDQDNIDIGKDSVIDRTRRLFYVCCSRALTGLAVVVFCADTERMKQAILDKGFFDPDDVHILD